MREQIKAFAIDLLKKAISTDYIGYIINDTDENGEHPLIELIIDDVIETSGYSENGHWNEDDVKLAIGRVLSERLNPYA